MAQKTVLISGVGDVIMLKKKGARSMRLSILHDGTIRVSIPTWSPYKLAEAFVLSKQEWIARQRGSRPIVSLKSSDRIGKGHRLRFVNESRAAIASRVTSSEIIVRLPIGMDSAHADSQKHAKKAAIRALKSEANKLLPGRLLSLAQIHSFTYSDVTIKMLKTRWGSCSSRQEIALNCFLMQLPWELIDYVILHELVHTQIMAHGKPFWDELGHYVNNLPEKRKAMRAYQPAVIAAI